MRVPFLLCLGFSILLSPAFTTVAATTDLSSLAARSVSVRPVDYGYPGARTYQSIRDVDFSNLRLFLDGNSYQLTRGLFSLKETMGREELSLDHVFYIADSGGVAEYAAIDLNFLTCGGSCSSNGFVKVFKLRDGRPFEIQEIHYNSQAPGVGVQFLPKTHALVVTGRFDDSSPNCCADALAVVTFIWNGEAFEMQDAKKQPVKTY